MLASLYATESDEDVASQNKIHIRMVFMNAREDDIHIQVRIIHNVSLYSRKLKLYQRQREKQEEKMNK